MKVICPVLELPGWLQAICLAFGCGSPFFLNQPPTGTPLRLDLKRGLIGGNDGYAACVNMAWLEAVGLSLVIIGIVF